MKICERMTTTLTKEEALELAESRWWEDIDLAEAASFQLRQAKLCMPFNKFHEGMGKLLGRPVWTHEFASQESLIAEVDGKRAAPISPIHSLLDIIGTERASDVVVACVGKESDDQ